jgi:hypothetical protein
MGPPCGILVGGFGTVEGGDEMMRCGTRGMIFERGAQVRCDVLTIPVLKLKDERESPGQN